MKVSHKSSLSWINDTAASFTSLLRDGGGDLWTVSVFTNLLAVQPLDLKVRVEVEDDALRRLRRCDDPVAVLVRRVLQRVTWGGDVARLGGI